MNSVSGNAAHWLHFLLPSRNAKSILFSGLTLGVSIPLLRYIYEDYHRFLALGPGANPSTPKGYLTVTVLRLFYVHSDLFQPPSVAQPVYPSNHYLDHLPLRSSLRPRTDGVAPHRQTDQHASPHLQKRMIDAFHALVQAHSDLLYEGVSSFEGHGLAIFIRPGTAQGDPNVNTSSLDFLNSTKEGEIAHVHETVS